VRDLIEIGMGRSARRGYDFADVAIVPSRRTRTSQDVPTAWQLDAYRVEIPLMTHPSDAVVSPDTAVRIGGLGGLGVLNAEGLWARHPDPVDALFQVARVWEDEAGPGAARDAAAVALLQRLHAAPIRADLLTAAIRQVRESGVTVAARVSPQRARELTGDLLAAGALGHVGTFIGNVEGRDLMTDAVDVVVTDGFTGNVALKLAEGLREFHRILDQDLPGRCLSLTGREVVAQVEDAAAGELPP